MSSLPEKIRAVHQPDKTSKRLVMVEAPMPKPSQPSEMLIKVKATCPCLGELGWEANYPHMFTDAREPVPGQDVAGTVVTAPEDSGFKAGDRVFGRISASRAGGCREYTVVSKEEMAILPNGLGWTEGVATPLSALTAWQAPFYQGTLNREAIYGDAEAKRVNAAQRVFIAGAATSVGAWAVQFAALAGAGAVIGLCSTSSAERIKKLGATEIVDYKKETASDWVRQDPQREADLVFDCVGGEGLAHLWDVVKDGGVFVSICGDPYGAKPDGNKKSMRKKGGFFIVESLGTQLAEIAKLVVAGKASPLVDDAKFRFDQFAEAFELVESRRARGKVVINVSED
ncbi:Reticulon-4-interacting protein-like protein [Hapsidospora chrysogenum ATCC 11550]|uniref:Reticulon-4-interacting protein-like protein n=1 Tax=Hapsidospora chrysogenum (strain ATCC 11550 / CBS 779.69 / DSM 880 / IAM 14645 / JCM 23072 / IMI 49137) TaxID=857340 RepID=A0A086TGR6_HAPC1|nr:Reticulon-4-interacting protein-like protein [Hapsidospora chrysogenum ATCC 11550]